MVMCGQFRRYDFRDFRQGATEALSKLRPADAEWSTDFRGWAGWWNRCIADPFDWETLRKGSMVMTLAWWRPMLSMVADAGDVLAWCE
jgi:hypothetical protein